VNLNLHEIESFPADLALEFEPDALDYESRDIVFKDLITVRLSIQKVGEEYFCQGYVTAPVEEECARCLTLFSGELSNDMSFIIKIGDPEANRGSKVIGESVIWIRPGDHLVDIGQQVREALILSVPLKPLCSPECKGLCSNCGANLNEEECDCKVKDIDDRWEGLKDLLE
jgi:uncharacterized protein